MRLAAGSRNEAVTLCRAALRIFERFDPMESGRLRKWLRLPGPGARPGPPNPASAERLLRQALGELRTTGSVHWQARTLEFRGETAGEAGDLARAAEFY